MLLSLLLSLLFLFLLAGAAAPAEPWDAVLHLHSNATRDAYNARCLDGSNGAYYFRPARSAAAATKWKIHFQGVRWSHRTPPPALL